MNRFLTNPWTWIATFLIAYLSSFIWLSAAAICVPIVLKMAPLGITSLFWPPLNPANANIILRPPDILLHIIFWPLFFAGLIGCKRIPPKVLFCIYSVILVLIVLTIAGCSKYYRFAGHTFN